MTKLKIDLGAVDLEELPLDKQWEVLCVLYPRDTMVAFRFTADEMDAWERAAAAEGKEMPHWIADILNEEAGIK